MCCTRAKCMHLGSGFSSAALGTAEDKAPRVTLGFRDVQADEVGQEKWTHLLMLLVP